MVHSPVFRFPADLSRRSYAQAAETMPNTCLSRKKSSRTYPSRKTTQLSDDRDYAAARLPMQANSEKIFQIAHQSITADTQMYMNIATSKLTIRVTMDCDIVYREKYRRPCATFYAERSSSGGRQNGRFGNRTLAMSTPTCVEISSRPDSAAS